jgi:glycosyltransferase involved in cell wall biosynthesis
MRIGIVHPYLNYFGGAERILAFTANHLAKNNDIILYSYQFSKTFLKKLDFIPELLQIPSFSFVEQSTNPLLKYWTIRAYLNLIKSRNTKSDCDIINYHNVPAPWMVDGLGKTIWFCQEPQRVLYDNSLILKDKLPKGLAFFVKEFAPFFKYFDIKKLKKMDIVCVNSIKMKKAVDKIYGLNSIVLPMPVHFPDETKFDYKKRTEQSAKSLSLLLVGGVELNKGSLRTFHSLRELLSTKRISILLEGDGKAKELLKRAVVNMNLRNSVYFIGRAQIITDLYKKADFVLINSINEPFGLTAIEGMYFGCIPLVRKDAGVSSLIKNSYNGFLFNSGKELKNILGDILEGRYNLELIRRNASKFVKRNCSLDEFNKALDRNFSKV